MIKEQAKEAMEELIREGYNPNRLESSDLMELPDDFRHQPPAGYRYEAFVRTLLLLQFGLYVTLGLFTMMVMMFVVSGDSTTPKKQQYHAPINSNKVGAVVDINVHDSLYCNATLNPLEYVIG